MSVRVAGPGRGHRVQDHKVLVNSEPPTARDKSQKSQGQPLQPVRVSDLTPTGMRKNNWRILVF